MDNELLQKAQEVKIELCCRQITSLLLQLDKAGVKFTDEKGMQVLVISANLEKKQIMLLPF